MKKTETLDNGVVLEDEDFIGSSATLDLAVADAYDRAMRNIPSFVNWNYSDFDFNMTLFSITVSGNGGKYDYDRNNACLSG